MMATLILFIFLATIFYLLVSFIIRAYRKQTNRPTLIMLVALVFIYAALWSAFYFMRSDQIVPLGTDVCFDDWCATITQIEGPEVLGNKPERRIWVVHIRMSNHAKGITQKPSEPRVYILDRAGNIFTYSAEGQLALEKIEGTQAPLDSRLALGQSLETQLAFDIPADAKGPKIMIEEGPWITKILLPESRQVFQLR